MDPLSLGTRNWLGGTGGKKEGGFWLAKMGEAEISAGNSVSSVLPGGVFQPPPLRDGQEPASAVPLVQSEKWISPFPPLRGEACVASEGANTPVYVN